MSSHHDRRMDMLEVQTAKDAARAGGEVLSRYFREGVTAARKAGEATYNLVSQADIEAEQAIVQVLRKAFPEHAILGEEEARADLDAEHLWIVDPLDGTNNFVHGIAHFSVSIAYHHHGQPQCGVVFNPVRDDWFVAERGRGAVHNNRPAHVSTAATLDEVLVGLGFYYDRGAMMEATLAAMRDLFRRHVHGIRRFGTASLDLVHVGCGWFGGYFEYELSPWDFAAGRLFVEEAGGRVTTCRNEPLPVAKTSLLASNGLLHDAIHQIVGPHFASLTSGGEKT